MNPEKIALEDLSKISDNRVVVLENPPSQKSIHDWAKGGNNGMDYWAFGELVSLAQSHVSRAISRVHVDLIAYIRSTVNPQKNILSSHDLGLFQGLNSTGWSV